MSPTGRLVDAQTYTFADDGRIPNSPLPVLIYHGVSAVHDPRECEELFAGHRWRGSWRNGIFPFHHFHSTAHEVLGIVSGEATVMLGGPAGRELSIHAGDVLVLPAGTGHCNLGSSSDLLVIGAYPDAMEWDLRRGDPAEHDEVLANIAAVPLPPCDPVLGDNGPLIERWGPG